MIIEIDNIAYTLREEFGFCEVEFPCAETGLNRVLVFARFPTFDFLQRRVVTEIMQYDITPLGQRINAQKFRYVLTEQDLADFENSIGVVMKKSILNGMFRNVIGNTYRIYDDTMSVVPQPVPFPEA